MAEDTFVVAPQTNVRKRPLEEEIAETHGDHCGNVFNSTLAVKETNIDRLNTTFHHGSTKTVSLTEVEQNSVVCLL